jgi:hypothetical protein
MSPRDAPRLLLPGSFFQHLVLLKEQAYRMFYCIYFLQSML